MPTIETDDIEERNWPAALFYFLAIVALIILLVVTFGIALLSFPVSAGIVAATFAAVLVLSLVCNLLPGWFVWAGGVLLVTSVGANALRHHVFESGEDTLEEE